MEPRSPPRTLEPLLPFGEAAVSPRFFPRARSLGARIQSIESVVNSAED